MSDTNFPPTDSTLPDPPVVAFVGRPNVGKSTLFNRLAGSRTAITDPTPGVTRDPVRAPIERDGKRFIAVDTGGFKTDNDAIDKEVRKRALQEAQKADLILFVMDVTETTAEDEMFAEELRRYTNKIILVANKADSRNREYDAMELYSFGFEDVRTVSAEHGDGCGDLFDEVALRIGTELPFREEEPDIRIAVLGKPNTGKSTLTNRLLEREASIVSDIPGTTRDQVSGVFQYKDNTFRIVDTAGIRKKKKVTENLEYYSVNRSIKALDNADIAILMIDSLEGVTDQDKKIINHAVKRGRGIILVLNKWDLQEDLPNQEQAVVDRTRFLFPVMDFAPILPASALNGMGVKEMMNTALKLWKQLNIRVDTGELNRMLGRWTEHQEAPRHTRGRYKIHYMTQTGTNPVEFVLFLNRKKGFPQSYISYIKNCIRKDLGISSIPINIHLRER